MGFRTSRPPEIVKRDDEADGVHFDTRLEGDGKDVPARVTAAGAPCEVMRAIAEKDGACHRR